MEEKKSINWFNIIMLGLFIVYISLYLLNKSGYYDGSMRRKVEFTSEQIEAFERDVENGVEVDINKYLVNQNKDYTNNASRLGYAISTNLDKFLNKGINEISKVLSMLFT